MTEPATLGLWTAFAIAVAALLAVHLGLSNKPQQSLSVRQSTRATLFWVGLSLAFSGGLWALMGRTKALEFLSGYCIEEALSVDNLFVFLLIFNHFKIGPNLQPRVLAWGIFGALMMRGLFIAAGAALLARFHWIFYGLGAFLVYTACRLLGQTHQSLEANASPTPGFLLRIFPWPITSELHGQAFFVVQQGRRHATPLALALCVVELSDVLFALDSVPAIFAITTDSFIVYTSNVFAILSLRSLYFVLAHMLDRFIYLKVGLGLILAFVGGKMLTHKYFEISALTSLATILSILGGTIAASFWFRPKTPDAA